MIWSGKISILFCHFFGKLYLCITFSDLPKSCQERIMFIMRKNKCGRPLKKENIKQIIMNLRAYNLSFSEIAKELKISRQLAFYHFKTAVQNSPIAK